MANTEVGNAQVMANTEVGNAQITAIRKLSWYNTDNAQVMANIIVCNAQVMAIQKLSEAGVRRRLRVAQVAASTAKQDY